MEYMKRYTTLAHAQRLSRKRKREALVVDLFYGTVMVLGVMVFTYWFVVAAT